MAVLLKSILARAFLSGHAVFAIYLVVDIKKDKKYWWLAAILFPLVIESVYTVGYRKSRQYKW
jgi:hypothetical protein